MVEAAGEGRYTPVKATKKQKGKASAVKPTKAAASEPAVVDQVKAARQQKKKPVEVHYKGCFVSLLSCPNKILYSDGHSDEHHWWD